MAATTFSMSSPTSSYAPSSSAVTIPTPGRSILKRPPPPNQSFFSRISKFLPNQNQPQASTGDESRALRRAHFILPELTTIYPISAANPPSTPLLKEEKRSIEQREAERRWRVVRGSPSGSGGEADEWWTLEKVESFYRECSASREDTPSPEISAAFMNAAGTNPRAVDFSGVQLTSTSAATLSDVFNIEWGLRTLTFRECDLDDRTLKPILHALLIPGTLTFLSVASNRRLKAPAFRLLGAFVSKAKSLQFLDLSQNSLDKKSVESIVAALPQGQEQGISSIKLDDCSLRPNTLETLAQAVRTSSLRNISLRHNRINATGAVAIALMIRDYPDTVTGSTPTSSAPSTPPMSPPPTHAILPHTSPINITAAAAASAVRSGPLPPPPKHPSANPQTTYTPYIPRSKRAVAATNPLSPSGQHVPIITSSAQGGVTTRHPAPRNAPLNGSGNSGYHDHGPSAALLDKVRALDALPRIGALRTLDLRGNDIRGGITYIAQVLKRNRTLKVLNLSENKLDMQGLVAIAEALKYNSSLETLDLSKNPCCGPGLDGVQSLRTAFTLNTALKRLFLSSTSMTSAGAIALAEFLPESNSLLHLDLTMNNLDLAGVMALSEGLKGNHIMRCLDLNIPPDDEQMARMCRNILNTCIRNTEEAERNSPTPPASGSSGRGQGKGVWGMIEESKLAKMIRQDDEKKVESQRPHQHDVPLLTDLAEQSGGEMAIQARACKEQLEELVARAELSSPREPLGQVDLELISKAKALLSSLAETIRTVSEPARLEELLTLNDTLTSLVAHASPRPKVTLTGLGIGLHDVKGKASPDTSLNGGGSDLTGSANGHVVIADKEDDEHETEAEEDVPATPRVDKGKGRAIPEPEEPEKVLSPNFVLESDDEDGLIPETVEDERSPTNMSRNWVAEEGEVFRRGNKLLGPEEMEGEYAGEELRIELLEAMVDRPPPRAILDDFGMEIVPSELPTSPKVEDPKPLPRPYISRRSSSASVTGQTGGVTSPVSTGDGAAQSPSTLLSPITPLSPGSRSYTPRRKTSNASLETH